MTTNQTPVDLLKQLIRQHKSSIFLRHSVASEKDLTAVAELLLQEVVRPYLELLRDKTMREYVAKQNQEASQITTDKVPYGTTNQV